MSDFGRIDAAVPFTDHPCDCRSEHAPSVPWSHAHHVWPLFEGGPDTAENIAYICPATHDWTHVILRVFAEVGGVTGRERHWPHRAYGLAVEGWEKMMAATLVEVKNPPSP